jgi:nicotinamidase/pyrazinamidase
VQHTPGSEFQGNLRVPLDSIFVEKATEPTYDCYSAFQDTNLAEILRRKRVTRVFVTGLALDYCVKATALDAKKLGFEVVLVEDATRGVSPETSATAIQELRQAGVQFARSGSIS